MRLARLTRRGSVVAGPARRVLLAAAAIVLVIANTVDVAPSDQERRASSHGEKSVAGLGWSASQRPIVAAFAGSPLIFASAAAVVQELERDDPEAEDLYGSSCDMVASSSHTVAIVGSHSDDSEESQNSGAAYIFVLQGPQDASVHWEVVAKLTPQGNSTLLTNAHFGSAVALHGGGSMLDVPYVALVGAAWDDSDGYDAGSAWVFTPEDPLDPTTPWSQRQRIAGTDERSWFGSSLSVGSRGDVIAVGAYLEGSAHQGATHILATNELGDPSQGYHKVQTLVADDATYEIDFGVSVSISETGNWIMAGAFRDETNGNVAGASYVFGSSDPGDRDSSWVQLAKITPDDGVRISFFGNQLRCSGEACLVGSYRHTTELGLYTGAAYVFAMATAGDPAGGWEQVAKLVPDELSEEDEFGRSVALEGTNALVGAWRRDAPGLGSGAVYYFAANTVGDVRSGWSLVGGGAIEPRDARAHDTFGASVAVAGNLGLAGALGHSDAALYQAGSAFVVTLCDEACGECPAPRSTAHECTTCFQGAAYDAGGAVPTTGTCTMCLECEPHEFDVAPCTLSSDRVCRGCDESCLGCVGVGDDQCTSCADGFYVVHPATYVVGAGGVPADVGKCVQEQDVRTGIAGQTTTPVGDEPGGDGGVEQLLGSATIPVEVAVVAGAVVACCGIVMYRRHHKRTGKKRSRLAAVGGSDIEMGEDATALIRANERRGGGASSGSSGGMKTMYKRMGSTSSAVVGFGSTIAEGDEGAEEGDDDDDDDAFGAADAGDAAIRRMLAEARTATSGGGGGGDGGDGDGDVGGAAERKRGDVPAMDDFEDRGEVVDTKARRDSTASTRSRRRRRRLAAGLLGDDDDDDGDDDDDDHSPVKGRAGYVRDAAAAVARAAEDPATDASMSLEMSALARRARRVLADTGDGASGAAHSRSAHEATSKAAEEGPSISAASVGYSNDPDFDLDAAADLVRGRGAGAEHRAASASLSPSLSPRPGDGRRSPASFPAPAYVNRRASGVSTGGAAAGASLTGGDGGSGGSGSNKNKSRGKRDKKSRRKHRTRAPPPSAAPDFDIDAIANEVDSPVLSRRGSAHHASLGAGALEPSLSSAGGLGLGLPGGGDNTLDAATPDDLMSALYGDAATRVASPTLGRATGGAAQAGARTAAAAVLDESSSEDDDIIVPRRSGRPATAGSRGSRRGSRRGEGGDAQGATLFGMM